MLGEFLRQAARKRGDTHCSSDVADWCMVQGWDDPAKGWRGLTDAECEAANARGLLELWEAGLRGVPLATGELREGDVALVHVMGLETGGIYTGERWAVRSGNGLTYITPSHAHVIKAWRP
jgi:hypothetical protein